MNIVVVGNDISFAECKVRFGDGHDYFYYAEPGSSHIPLRAGAVFDFSADWTDERLSLYANIKDSTIFLNTVFTTLSNLLSGGNVQTPFFGFCGLPTFFNRSILEITSVNPMNTEILERTMEGLDAPFKLVKDQVGMVTPRIIAMIINEACEAFRQGVASREDIDLSMKLGTNYPFGPFEWAEKLD